MATMTTAYPAELMQAWANVIARAWKDPEFQQQLTRDPKGTIEANPDNPDFLVILSHGEGFLPIPGTPEGLQDLNEEQLAAFANQSGVFGIMRLS